MRTITAFLSLLLLAVPLSAQEWKQQPAKEMVTIKAGKMVSDEYELANIHVANYPPAQVQLKVHSEGPATGLMSRDNFVALTTQIVVLSFYGAYSEAYKVPASEFMQAVDLTDLAAPIGSPDIEINVFMTKDGMQFEWVDTASGKKTRSTTTWADVFKK